MPYRITIEELQQIGDDESRHFEAVKRFEQTLDELDLRRIVAVINTKPRLRRAAKKDKAAT